ncbi:MAG: hypothetical protein A4E63_01015 [Syntrophorhabdus sp. PtaU1.Bin050]|nr:MAG: hypothetical protein A4E63_01015 [Syntrophorhabdus sp. PtaU1.Bin050]
MNGPAEILAHAFADPHPYPEVGGGQKGYDNSMGDRAVRDFPRCACPDYRAITQGFDNPAAHVRKIEFGRREDKRQRRFVVDELREGLGSGTVPQLPAVTSYGLSDARLKIDTHR